MKKFRGKDEANLAEQEKKETPKIESREPVNTDSDFVIPTESVESESTRHQAETVSSEIQEAPERASFTPESDLKNPDPVEVLSDAAKAEVAQTVEGSLKAVEGVVEGAAREAEQLASETAEAVKETIAGNEKTERRIDPLEPLKVMGKGFKELFEHDNRIDQMTLDLFGLNIENPILRKVVSSAILLGSAAAIGGILYFEWWLVAGIFL